MSIVISTSPSRTRDANSSNFIAVDNGIWFEFQANGSPVESSMRLNITDENDAAITTTDIILNFSTVDNKVYFDVSPYLQAYLSNQNANTYTANSQADNNAVQGFKIVYGEYPEPSPTDETTTAAFYALKSALEYGSFYGQNMAAFVPFATQVSLQQFLTQSKRLKFYSGYPIDISFIGNDYVNTYTQTEYLNNTQLNSNLNVLTSGTNKGTTFLTPTLSDAAADKIELFLEQNSLFTFTVKTDNTGTSNNDQFTLPTESTGTYNYTVIWGDGKQDDITTWNDAAITHTYASAGTYNVTISGTFTGWRFNNGGDARKLTIISQWGALNLGNNGRYFSGCNNLTITAIDILDLSGTIDLSYAFNRCDVMTDIPSINSWNVSSVTNMQRMFQDCPVFAPSTMNSWNVSNVTSMLEMFYATITLLDFNANITSWVTTSLTNCQRTFNGCKLFNQDISGWDVSSVTTMEGMFSSAVLFKQDLSTWNFQSCLNFTNFLSGGVDINNPNSATNTTNYDALIIKLEADAAAVDPAQDNLSFHGGNSHYSSGAAVTAHNNLTGATPAGNGWTITDGGTP